MIAWMVLAQLCTASPAGGVVVTEGRGGYGAVIAAHPGALVVGWQETGAAPPTSEGAPPGWRPRIAFARELDPSTLSPRAPAREIAREEVFFAHMTGLSAAPSPAGDGAAIAWCECYGGSGHIGCELTPFGRFPPVSAAREAGGCSGGIALGTAGPASLLAFTDSAAVLLAGSRSGRAREGGDAATADRMALARADGDRAVLAWRTGDSGYLGTGELSSDILAMTVDADARPGSRSVTLSEAPWRAGAPAAAWADGAALVAFARAQGARSPWRLALATWTPGRRHSVSALPTGRAPATAPSLAAAPSGGCAVLSWTEGTGRRTIVRAGRVCHGALDPTTVAQVSRAGVEAGESELATDGRGVYVVWQEIPAARGSPAELRAARLECR
jgi:hypothetical protein